MIYNAYQSSSVGIGGISIVSSGHIFADHGRHINRPNGRDDFLLLYTAKGEMRFCLDTDTDAKEGGFVLYRPHEKQEHLYTGKQPGELYFIHFNAPDNFDLFGFESSKVYTSQISSNICELFEEIIEELQVKRRGYERICVSKFFLIMALLERNIANEANHKNQYENKILFAVQLMNKEYEKNYTLDEYAELCTMSKFHFLRVFKEITGSSPMEYRNRIRIDHAKELLEDSAYSVSEIGRKVGYLSDSYFCDAFKNKVGMSPTQYRKSVNRKR